MFSKFKGMPYKSPHIDISTFTLYSFSSSLFNATFHCAGVELRFRGAARAKWREYVNEGVRRTEIEHEKEEIYFDDRFCLWGKGKCIP